MSTDDTWTRFYAARYDELSRRAEALGELPQGTLAAVRTIEVAQELIDEYRQDAWVPTKVIVARIGQRRAWLLSRLEEDELALSELDSLASEAMAWPDPEVVEVGADARLDRTRLLWALGRHGQAFTDLRRLIKAIAHHEHPGVRHTHANAQFDAIRWTAASVGEPDGVHGQQRIIDACAELIAAHRGREYGPEAFYVVVAHIIQVEAHLEQARLLQIQGADADAEALLVRIQILADDIWKAYAHHQDPQVQGRVAHLVLLSRDQRPLNEAVAVANMVLNRWQDSDEPDLAPELAWAMQLRVRGLCKDGKVEEALNTLNELAQRFSTSTDSRVRSSVLWCTIEQARIWAAQGHRSEALAQLQSTTAWLNDDPTESIRSRVVDALVEALGLVATELEDPVEGWDARPESYASSVVPSRPLTPEARDYAAVVDLIVQRFADDESAIIREQAADALYDLAQEQRKRMHLDEATDTYQRLIGIFGEDTQPGIEQTVASGSLNLGYLLMVLRGRHSEALEVYEALLARHERATSTVMRDIVAKAAASRLACLDVMARMGSPVSYGAQYEDLSVADRDRLESTLDWGITLSAREDHRGAIECYDQILTRIESLHPDLRRRCLDALVRKAYSLGVLGQYEAALAANREAEVRYGNELSVNMQRDVALAMSNACGNLDSLGRHEEEITVYRRIIDRWKDSSVDDLRARVAQARIGLASTLYEIGRHADGEIAYRECMEEGLRDHAPDIRYRGATAGVSLSWRLRKSGRLDESVMAAQRVLSACAHEKESRVRIQVAKAQLSLARSLAQLGRRDEAAVAYEQVLAAGTDEISEAERGAAREELFKLRPSRGLLSLLKGARRWFERH